jgi:outer membrane beta-barrel protein
MRAIAHILAVAAALAALPSAPARAAGDCVDEKAKAKLLESKRTRRGGEERDFIKAGRHEISVLGGYLVSDLFEGTFVVGGSYTYHLTEDVGIEASFAYSKVRSSVAARLEADHGVRVLPPEDRMLLFFSDAMWSPFHGKAQIFSDFILHFDIYGSLGVGLIDNQTSLGIAGRAGLGIKVFLGKAVALRLDLRDHVYQQQVLETRQIVQDISITLGISLFLPVTP